MPNSTVAGATTAGVLLAPGAPDAVLMVEAPVGALAAGLRVKAGVPVGNELAAGESLRAGALDGDVVHVVDVDKGVAELLAARLPVAVALAERDEMGVPDAVVLSLPLDVCVELLVLVPEPVPEPVTVTDAAAVPLAEAVLVTLAVDVEEAAIRVCVPVAAPLAERDELGVPDAVAALVTLGVDVAEGVIEAVPAALPVRVFVPVAVPLAERDELGVPDAVAALVMLRVNVAEGVDVEEGVIEAVPDRLPVRVCVPVAAPLAGRDELGVPDAVAALVTLGVDVAEGAVEVLLVAPTERALVTTALDEPVPVQLEAVALGVALPVLLPVADALPEPLRRLATLRPRYVSRATMASGDSSPAPTAPAAASHSSTDSRSPPV